MEGSPSRVTLRVEGGGTPCTKVGPVTQLRRGNLIDVRLDTYWPAQYCVMSWVQIEHTTELQGPFAPGDYVVRANGVEARFRI